MELKDYDSFGLLRSLAGDDAICSVLGRLAEKQALTAFIRSDGVYKKMIL